MLTKNNFSINILSQYVMAIIGVFGLVLLAMPAVAGAAPDVSNRYIVVLKGTVADSRGVANEHARSHQAKVTRVYDNALRGYAAELTPGAANSLQGDSRVAYIEKDGIARTQSTQTGAVWGLDRIDQRTVTANGTYNYTATGAGVKAYIIDTGIRPSHAEFGGRVTDGFDAYAATQASKDCNGHGTHVAGTVGGTQYGVAKGVSLVAVRVLDCAGSGYWSDIIAGVDYVTADHKAGQPAVANMSLGGGASTAVDTAVKNSIADGVSYVVAAGNSNADACRYSPARVPEALTIGASTRTDSKASFSNFGKCLDWYAPGESIMSAWYTSDIATNSLSGTSMASPHSAGVAALHLQSNPAASAGQVRAALYDLTTKSIITKARGVSNHLLYTNY